MQPKKPIVRGIQEIKHEPNLSLDNQNLAVAYCHVVMDMQGEGTLSSGSTWIFFLPSRISHVFATDPCGHRMRRCQDLLEERQSSKAEVRASDMSRPCPPKYAITRSFFMYLGDSTDLSNKFLPVARRNLKVLSQLWPCYVESSTRVTKPFPSTSTWSFHCEKLSLSFAHMSNPQCF